MRRRSVFRSSAWLAIAIEVLGALSLVLVFGGQLFAQNPVTITTPSPLPSGAVGTPYPPQALTASGGTGTISWEVLPDGTFPRGLVLSGSGILSGTPQEAGTFNFLVRATSSGSSGAGSTSTRSLSITISLPLVITTTETQLPLGVAGAFYSQAVEATGPSQINWAVVSRILPPGISLTSTGSFVGIPTIPGTYDFTVEASSVNPVQTARKALRIVVNPPLSISTLAALPRATRLATYFVLLAADGGLPPYTWTSLTSLPLGLTLSDTGVLSGTPTGLGSFSFAVQVTDSFSPKQTVSRTFTLDVTSPITITTLSLLPGGIQGQPYSQQLLASAVTAVTWVVSGGALPDGLTLSAAGLLQGTPVTAGSSSFTATATDLSGATASRNFTLNIDPPLPSASLLALPPSLSPAQSSEIVLELSSAHPSPLTGVLTLTFASNAEVPFDDPMTRFSNGLRTANFTIPAGSTRAVFPSQLLLLTGTVAGTVRLTASIQNGPSNVLVGTVEIPASAPHLTNVVALKRPDGIDLQITGYSPSRRVATAEFNFDVKTGSTTQQVRLTRAVDAEFAAWFTNPASAAFGGSFSFVQSFSIQGDASQIEGVTVRLTNAQGSTSSATVRPQ